MFVSSANMIQKAREGHYAVPAFNAENLEMVQAIITAAAEAVCTDPREAAEFAAATGVSMLAVAIGTAHGFYIGTPVLDKERVSQLKEATEAPLVMHGASGLSEEDVRECAARGIAKVNFATELRKAYTDAMRELLTEHPEIYDPKKPGKAGMEAVKEIVKSRIIMCGCENKAK